MIICRRVAPLEYRDAYSQVLPVSSTSVPQPGTVYKGPPMDSSNPQATHLVLHAHNTPNIIFIATMKFIAGLTGVLALAVAVLAVPSKRDAATVERDITAINAGVLRLDRMWPPLSPTRQPPVLL